MAVETELSDIAAQFGQAGSNTLVELICALGFRIEDKNRSYVPYIQYIKSSWPRKGEEEDFLRLFISVVSHFKGGPASPDIQSYIDTVVSNSSHPYFSDTDVGSEERKTSVTDTVLLILGVWTLMQSYFIPLRQRQRRLVVAYCLCSGSPYSETQAFGQALPRLLKTSGLLPHPDERGNVNDGILALHVQAASLESPFGLHQGLMESQLVELRRLNAYTLSGLAGVRILWTENISRHLLLSKIGQKHYLELFALPCTLQDGPDKVLSRIGISTGLMEEIQMSYANLFNPVEISATHERMGKISGIRHICWCLGCASWRLRRQEVRRRMNSSQRTPSRVRTACPYDPLLQVLMDREPNAWDQVDFSNLWPRILTLNDHLQEARPWNFWVLFRDNRDTVQYWTFLFGSIILILTVVQVVLGAAQVAGSFIPGQV